MTKLFSPSLTSTMSGVTLDSLMSKAAPDLPYRTTAGVLIRSERECRLQQRCDRHQAHGLPARRSRSRVGVLLVRSRSTAARFQVCLLPERLACRLM